MNCEPTTPGNSSPERAKHLRGHLSSAALLGTLAATSLLGGKITSKQFGSTEGKVCSITVEVEQDVFDPNKSPSATVRTIDSAWIEFPGAHDNPVLKTRARVTDVDKAGVAQLRKLIDGGNEQDVSTYEQKCRDDAEQLLERSARRTILAGTAGALIASLSVWGLLHTSRKVSSHLGIEKRRGALLIPSAVVLAGLPALGSLTWGAATFDEQAVKNPVYKGYLADLEDTIDLSQQSLEGYQAQGREFTKWVEQIAQLQEKLVEPDKTPDYITILSISDIHSRPCAYERVSLLYDAFGADFITNEGDEVEWDERESNLLVPQGSCKGIDGPGDIDAEIVQVEGNHDNDGVMAKLGSLSNVTVLDNQIVRKPYNKADGSTGKVRILGIADKRYEADDFLVGQDEAKTDLLKQLSDEEITNITSGEYDILMVHDPKLIKELNEAGLLREDIKLISTGHTHKNKVDLKTADAPILTTGSSGGGGLRSFERTGQPSEYSVVYLDPDTKEVVKISLISVTNEGEISIRNVNVVNS